MRLANFRRLQPVVVQLKDENNQPYGKTIKKQKERIARKGGKTKNRITCVRNGTLIMTGTGEGIDVSNSRLELKGGTLQSFDREGIKLSNESRAVISGGRIQTSKNGARGISIDGTSTLTLKGGIIKSTAPKSMKGNLSVTYKKL